jgi:hypothetical protein
MHSSLCLAASFMLVSCLAYSSTLKVEAISYYETSVDFHRTSLCHIPEDRTLQLEYILISK